MRSTVRPGAPARWEVALAGAVFLAGLVLRLRLAATTYLNPDEAYHALLSTSNWRDLWNNSLTVAHPPLLILVAHMALMLSRSELAVRLVPVLAGSLFPVLIYVWLRKVSGRMAAMAALLLLTLAPHLVEVSAQLRSYTLAFLLLAAALLALERALDEDRWQWMVAYSVLLCLCILSDYSMAFFVGAAGVYCLLRIANRPGAVKAAWAAGQLAAAALYGALFVMQVRSLSGGGIERAAVSGWLYGAFPRPGEMWAFPFVNTVKPFAYLMASIPAGAVALAMFVAAAALLCTGRTGSDRGKARGLAALLVVPFLLNMAGAYSHFFPYGRSRHSLVVGLFAACGVGIFVETLPRRLAITVLWGALLLTPIWYKAADRDQQNIAPDRNQKVLMVECLDYMHRHIPPNTLV